MFEAGICVYISASGAALIPMTIPVKYFDFVVMLHHPRMTIFRQPTLEQLEHVTPGSKLQCRICGLIQTPDSRGLQWCLACWNPITWRGVQDRHSWLLNAEERKKELQDRYGITPADFHAILGTPG